MGGIKIGVGTVIAAGEIATKDVPRHCIGAGNLAGMIRINVTWGAISMNLTNMKNRFSEPHVK